MTAPPPPKIKAFLGVLKDQYLDHVADSTADDAKTNDLGYQDLFEGLVKAELILRGVLASGDSSSSSKLWQQVQSSIGKPLLDDTNIPKPLLAGANVVAGRLAEAIAAATATQAADAESSFSKYSVDASILKRAKDIPDIRWIMLLEQDVSFLEMARGYFSTAALIQIDTPPMWKKVVDAWTMQGSVDEAVVMQTPFEAQVALEELIRIASSKGNAKRTAELQIRLVCSYLNPQRIQSTTTKIGKQSEIGIAETFGDCLTAKIPTDVAVAAQKAQQVLMECSVQDLSDTDQRLLPVLRVRIAMALEDAKVEALAEHQHQVNQHRSVMSLVDTCRVDARNKLYLEDVDSIFEASQSLRDSVSTQWSCQAEKEASYWEPSLETLGQCIERLQQRALVKIQKDTSKGEGWKRLLDYVLSLLQSIQKQCQWSGDRDRRERMQRLSEWLGSASTLEQSTVSLMALSTTEAYWMLLTSGLSASIDNTLKFTMDLLSALRHHGASLMKSQVPSAVGSKSKQSRPSIQWKQAQSILICGIAQDNQVIIDQVSREAVATKKEDDAALGYLHCMVAWSGWFQRPWSYCSNLSDIRRILTAAQLDGERSLGAVESLLLNLARADAELLNGGFPKVSQQLYSQVLDDLDSTHILEDFMAAILRTHCSNGLARSHQAQGGKGEASKIQDFARKALATVESLQIPEIIKPLHIWHEPSIFHSAISYQRSLARQIIADSFLSEGKIEEAREFLEAAVHDAPLDPGAALAFGAFLLRVAYYIDEKSSPDEVKAAQIQLLKAAKLDATKADPFALLGVWFEESGDANRALGCFTKSLSLDRSNPIAGRGLLRLKGRESMIEDLDDAIDSNSPLNGWAWRAIGLNKMFLEAEDDFAVVALLKALRSRDVSAPEKEMLGTFYQLPNQKYVNERADALADLATCYRRLGRFTASIRAFQASIDSSGDDTPASVLCSCAQVELELSLFDEAAEKFGRVLLRKQGSSHSISAYGQGLALYRIAQRDLEDGKAGSAFARIQNAIESCENFSLTFGCTRKLLGDLYSFGAVLPPDLFSNGSGPNLEGTLERQLEFIRKGESAFRTTTKDLTSDSKVEKAASICDIGSNILLQAHLCESVITSNGIAQDLYQKAQQEFEAALELYPLYAPAWCGLGCAVISKDPLFAQHAFARCLQLEPMFPDAYSNVGFLYTSKRAFGASGSVMNALTQVADTPLMWMNRAFILERSASTLLKMDGINAASKLAQASDAYRAAMQVMKHPEAQLGLATTVRVAADETKESDASYHLARKDSLAFAKEYNGGSLRLRGASLLLQGVITLDQTYAAKGSWIDDGLRHGESLIAVAQATKDLEGSLNLQSIDSIMEAKTQSEGDTKTEASLNFPGSISLQRQILHEPNRGDLWLALSKELLESGNGDPSSIASAAAAATRASTMLTDELIRPRQVAGKFVSCVDSQTLSEALALGYWLESNTSTTKQQGEAKDDESSAPTTVVARASSYALQRALMMDPTNPIAREALKFSQ